MPFSFHGDNQNTKIEHSGKECSKFCITKISEFFWLQYINIKIPNKFANPKIKHFIKDKFRLTIFPFRGVIYFSAILGPIMFWKIGKSF